MPEKNFGLPNSRYLLILKSKKNNGFITFVNYSANPKSQCSQSLKGGCCSKQD
jgi:pyridoxine/pyridoxamine 5'-phosphate oxidase